MKSYQQIMQQLHTRPRYAKKKDLNRIRNLMAALGDVQKRLRFVHVAGTNGKGSVCALTAAALRQAGYRVGLFTSPYLKEFEERIQVNGMLIPKETLCRLAERVFAAQQLLEKAGGDPANEFEMITAIGMLWFEEQQCDYVVLEVGLGGRLDATNVIDPPECCCITAIGLDHTQQLGNTVAQVAGEKAGIIKPGCRVVTPFHQDPAALTVLKETCCAVGAELRQAQEATAIVLTAEKTSYCYGDLQVCLPLAGAHQVDNSVCALEICRTLGLDDATILNGFQSVQWPGRLQILSKTPWTLLDCAHNPPGIEALTVALDMLYSGKPLTVVMAMMQDKDYESCVYALASRADCFVATTLKDMPRALDAQRLAETAGQVCEHVFVQPDQIRALKTARDHTPHTGLLLICGSVYLAGEILRIADGSTAFDKV